MFTCYVTYKPKLLHARIVIKWNQTKDIAIYNVSEYYIILSYLYSLCYSSCKLIYI